MALKKISLIVSDSQRGKRLDQLIADWLPEILGQPVSKAKARKLILAGAVYLNGKRVRIASKELLRGARVEAFVDVAKLMAGGPSQDKAFEMTSSEVLFEDDYLIAVAKPPGLPTQATLDQARDHLFAATRRFLAKRQQVAQPYLGLHHRLDRDTSGVVLFTKRLEANKGIAEIFSGHRLTKVYQAIAVRGPEPLSSEWTVKNFLGRDPAAKSKAARFTAVRSGGDYAETRFKVLEALEGALWVEARPTTGRTHQIRVHLAGGGTPILGDTTYGRALRGALAETVPRLMLHALSLTFEHPIHRTEVSVLCPLPEDFRQCLRRLSPRRSGD